MAHHLGILVVWTANRGLLQILHFSKGLFAAQGQSLSEFSRFQ